MGLEIGERPRKGTETFIRSATCDRCGANAYRPSTGGGTVACLIQRLKRPTEAGNWPEPDTPIVLCHHCADWLAGRVEADAADYCVCGNGEAEEDRGAVLRCPVHRPRAARASTGAPDE